MYRLFSCPMVRDVRLMRLKRSLLGVLRCYKSTSRWTLNFKLRREDLSFIGSDSKPIVEPGEFEVRVAGLTQKFTVK